MAEILLNNKGLVAVVDDEDYELASLFTWYASYDKSSKSFYAYTAVRCDDGKQRRIALHRLITGVYDSSTLVDHKDHDTLNNRRVNLRPATQSQNQFNQKPRGNGQSEYKGVSRTTRQGTHPWRAQIRLNGKKVHLGIFSTEVEAAKVYDKAAHEHFGDFAYLNFPLAVGNHAPELA